jgi:hypothetical protein
MPYTIDRYSGAFDAIIVEDGTVDSTLDIKLIGKNYAGYGEVQNENFVHLLENFAGGTEPPRRIAGQIWYNSSTKKLLYFDGVRFKVAGGAAAQGEEPSGLIPGDFWFDTENDLLYVWNGTEKVLIGPQGIAGAGTIQMKALEVIADDDTTRYIIVGIVEDIGVFTVSSSASFTLSEPDKPAELEFFTEIKPGLTLSSDSGFKYHGVASDSDKLGGIASTNFVQKSGVNAEFTNVASFSNSGFTVGTGTPKLECLMNGSTPTVRGTGSSLVLGVGTKQFLKIFESTNKIIPDVTNTYNIGDTDYKFAQIYATQFNGTATQANTVREDGSGDYVSADILPTPGTVACRTVTSETIDGTEIVPGSIKGEYFVGIATQAQFADLAEKYLADSDYSVGTVVTIGGSAEVTASSSGDRALGVVSASPAYMMNSTLEGGTYIALKGRVPVKTIGPVNKGDRLIAANDGCAERFAISNTISKGFFNVFAIALESNSDSGVKLVEAVIL